MACCGRQDLLLHPQPAHSGTRPTQLTRPGGLLRRGREVPFEYVGRTALVVFGPFTGRRYRFDRPGARVSVDMTDAASLASVPNLRRTRRALEDA